MEKRWAKRRSVQISVNVRYRDMEIVNCLTRDVGLNGAFVEVKQIQPVINAPVDLLFRMGDDSRLTKYKVQGKVARTAGDGIGVVFNEQGISSFRTLREVLYS